MIGNYHKLLLLWSFFKKKEEEDLKHFSLRQSLSYGDVGGPLNAIGAQKGAWKITKGDSMIQKHALLLVGVLSTKMHAGLSNYYLWLQVHQYQNSNLQHMLKDWSSKNAFRRRQKKTNSRENYNPRQHGKIRHRQHTDASWSNRLVPLSADFLHRSSDISFQTLITPQVPFLI